MSAAASQHSLNVEVWPIGSDGDQSAIDFEDVQYVSFVNGDTYGKPALVASEFEGARAGSGDKVVYINPANVAAVQIERVA